MSICFPFPFVSFSTNQMKSGPFAEHSNVLWGISSVKIWDKVNSGLIKMYKAEVCGLSFNYLFLIKTFLCQGESTPGN